MQSTKTLPELLEEIDENMKKFLNYSKELIKLLEDFMEKNNIG